MSSLSYRRHRFPIDVIQQAVWLYFQFPLSLRNVEDLLANVTSMSRMKLSVVGRSSLVSPMLVYIEECFWHHKLEGQEENGDLHGHTL
jgi:hypothetical protein